jgi:hypothetical protein
MIRRRAAGVATIRHSALKAFGKVHRPRESPASVLRFNPSLMAIDD